MNNYLSEFFQQKNVPHVHVLDLRFESLTLVLFQEFKNFILYFYFTFHFLNIYCVYQNMRKLLFIYILGLLFFYQISLG